MQHRLFIHWLVTLLFISGVAIGTRSKIAMAQGGPGDMPGEPAEVLIVPQVPTATEAIQITVKGIWPDGCVPEYEQHVIVDSHIVVMVAPSQWTVCGQVVTPWSFEITIDALPAADYQVDVQGAVTASTTLTVVTERIYLPLIGK